MKKAIIIALTGIILTLAAGCRRVSHNGEIDGFWKVTSVDNKVTGKTTEPGGHISIQCELLQMSGCTGVISYDKKAKKLTVDFREPAERNLSAYGIYSNPVTFDVTVNRKKMVLSSPETIITCRKW